MRHVGKPAVTTAALFLWISMTAFLLVTSVEITIAQPPPLFEKPEQTPIDGGLGILAAIGGAYAIKKLREKD